MNHAKEIDSQSIDIQTILSQSIQQLSFSSDTPRLDAEILLCFVLNVQRTHLYTQRNKILNPQQIAYYQKLIFQRAQGKPIAYLTGHKSFWSFDVQVTESTLIPRPETELLVECALAHLPVHSSGYVIDLGTGSGAIALAIAKECPNYQILAIDCSISALTIAQINACRLHIENIRFLACDWYTALGKIQATVIVSNPPYLAENDKHLIGDGVKYEPRNALISRENGLADLRHIIEKAKFYLIEKGWLFVEHGYQQSQEVDNFFEKQKYSHIKTYADLAGLPRVTGGQNLLV